MLEFINEARDYGGSFTRLDPSCHTILIILFDRGQELAGSLQDIIDNSNIPESQKFLATIFFDKLMVCLEDVQDYLNFHESMDSDNFNVNSDYSKFHKEQDYSDNFPNEEYFADCSDC